ncbi:MAG: hypothetical protein HKO66_06705 [Saprospiraceae bacterium]|nr:hypothetical protein [Bacteroidia bacterium]NNE14861.1 hypothetical protein [Saprospiraceae bacterium]NNL91903.1 hypothetical protein [Saprospiraceae bacterium]
MQTKLLTVLFLAVSNALLLSSIEFSFSKGPSSQFIYGKIITHGDEVYQGQIRWGTEEAFWFDFFNSTKPENENLKWLSKDEVSDLNDKDYESNNSSWSKMWNKRWHYSSDHTHIFACQFGDIKSIDIKRKEKIRVTFKNGDHYDLEGGSNDVGAKVQVYDEELGKIKLGWNKIKRVEFMETPSNLESRFGDPLYGTVKTYNATFEGFLQWDHDERLSYDELNGHTDDGEMDIEFGKIQSIKKTFRGSDVTLKSGRSFKLDGTNDVNDENRGIIVNMPNYGRVDIPWDEFEEITFTEIPSNIELGYNDYNGSKVLNASVQTISGDTHTGQIIFDLDEQYELEILDGMIDDIEYFIPFGAIKSITPKNRNESLVVLTNGEQMLFEDKVDVSESNDGIIVIDNSKKEYIPWSKVEKITFE